MLCAAGAFQIWRRDLVEELGGWSRSSPARTSSSRSASTSLLREQRRDPIASSSLPDCVGVTEGPDTMRKLVSQRERWQRVILETCWANRRMLLNPRYGTVGMLGMPFYVLSEIVAPLFEIVAVATLFGRRAAGLVDGWEFVVLTLAITFGNSALTTGALADAGPRGARRTAVAASLVCSLLMPLELFVYRPFMGWARVKGTWRCLRGDKGWHKFERNVRTGRRERAARARGRRTSSCSSSSRGWPASSRSSSHGRRPRSRSVSGSRPRQALGARAHGPVRLLVRRSGPTARSRSRSQAESDVVRNLLSAIPDGLMLVRDGEICSVNRSLCELLGYQREELARLDRRRSRSGRRSTGTTSRPGTRTSSARGELTSRSSRSPTTGRPRPAPRLRAASSTTERRPSRHLLTVRDVSTSHRRACGGSPSSRRAIPRRASSTAGSSRSVWAPPSAGRSRAGRT